MNPELVKELKRLDSKIDRLREEVEEFAKGVSMFALVMDEYVQDGDEWRTITNNKIKELKDLHKNC